MDATIQAEKNETLIEAKYPLSPLQQGMLFHHMLAPGSGVDIEQMVCSLREAVNVTALRAAWEKVVARHAILRTAFRWEGLEQPVQEVSATIRVPFAIETWWDLSSAEQDDKLQEYLKADRARGFAMNEAPMMRLALFQRSQQNFTLVWTFHHALLDGRSFPIVLKEVFAFYEAGLRGQSLELPTPRAYRDYIEWLDTLDLVSAEQFWRGLLKGFSSATPLVVDRPASEAEGARQGDEKIFLTEHTTSRLESLAKENGFTLNTFIQGAWALLLHRYSGEEDVVFGATRACRRSAVEGADAMVGLFINTLPVRARIEQDASLLDWLRNLRGQWTAMRNFEHTPLAQVQNWSAVGAGKSLFDSILVFENYLLSATLRGQGGAWNNRDFRLYEQTNFPITVTVYGGAKLCLQIEFDRSRFEEGTIVCMLGHFKTLLESMVLNPQQRLADLPLLTRAEREEIVGKWNATKRNYPTDALLHHLFEAQVAKTPEVVALRFDRNQITYRELNRRANQLANHLRKLGVRPDQLVGVCMERSLEMVIALYGIVKAGGAYVPIDPEYPADRVAFMIADAGVSVLLTQKHLVAQLPAHSARVICLDSEWNTIGQESEAKPEDEISATNLAYMIYTSGSTGKPKGAMNTHRGICNRLVWMQEQYQIGPSDVVLQKTPFSFDVSVWEFFWPLLTGAQLVIAKPGGHKDAAYLVQLIQETGVTTLHFVPPMLRVFLDEAGVEGCRSLRHVVCSGEALPFDLQEKLFGKLGAQLHNLYGPTEAAVDVTHWTCQRDGELRIVPIGKPVANTQCYVLDTRMRPVPIGVPGELHLGGVQIGRGYHNRPELTADKFINDPFNTDGAARLYKTGDLCRYLPDGNIEYLGRLDHQVKIRGFRIELGEIEARLAEHPAVQENVVVARQDSGEKRLVAYLVATQQPVPSVSDLRDHLIQSLPDFMVPSAFVWLEALPLSPNGKVDRKVLPAPEAHRPSAGTYVAPRNATEEILAKAWAEVLRIERVGIEDNFFELGGDSILMIQIIARTRAKGLALTPKLIFKHPTIAQLSSLVQQTDSPASEQGLASGEVILTPVQQWFIELDVNEPDHWNQAFLFRTRERLDANVLRKAVEQLERHHDALRLRFQRVGGVWKQTYAAPGEASFAVVQRPSDAKSLEQVCVRAQASLNLATGPIYRVVYFESGTEGRLLFAIHHLAVDGISWRVLLEDLENAYAQLREGKPMQLPAKTASFQLWSQSLAEFARNDAVRGELNFWRDIPSSILPRDGSGAGANVEGAARTITISLEPDETRDLLQRVPAVFHSQINDALLMALVQSIGNWTGQSGVTLDLEGHGREDIADGLDVSRTVGWFTTVFPVHLDVGSSKEPVAALRRVKEQLRAVPNRGIGYGLLRYLGADSELKLQPQPEIIFNYFGQFDQVVANSKLFAFADGPSGEWRNASARRRYSLDVNALVTDGRLEVRWTFAPGLHQEETIQHVAEDFVAALRELIHASERPDLRALVPSDFPLAGLDQVALDRIGAAYGNVEEIFPLSPVQRLFHTLESAGNSVGFDQYYYTVRGELDAPRFRAAWEKVLKRHAVLRTAFVTEGLKQPLQVVQESVTLPWVEEDWRGAVDREAKFAMYLQADRAKGFDVTKAPLMRCSLIRLSDAEWRFMWSHHHLQVDGWSWPLIFREVAQHYAHANVSLPPARSFGEYIEWLGDRCTRGEEEFWRDNLRGLAEPTQVPRKAAVNGASGFAEETIKLSAAETEELSRVARSGQITLNTLAQAAWAAVLSRQSGRNDVVLGVAFSGRPAELTGVEGMVGSLVSNLPVRVSVSGERKASDWLRDIQGLQAQLSTHQFASPIQIQEWSELPGRYRLFESLVVFQNYVIDETAWRLGSAKIDNFVAPIRTNFPLTLVIEPGAELRFTLVYDTRVCDAKLAADLLRDVTAALRSLAKNLTQRVSDLLANLSAPVVRATAPKLQGTSQNYIAPQTELEKVIAAIWRRAFGIERVGTADNFFDLGGHSLLMVQVHTQICAALNREISIVRMFQYPTVGALGKFLGQASAEPGFEKINNRAQLQRAALARQRVVGKRNA